jgi:hypothetical protein
MAVDELRTAHVVEAPAPLTSEVASALSSTTKSRPFWPPRTPRWILRCFEACGARVPVQGGAYRVNRVRDERFGTRVASQSDAVELPSLSLRGSALRPEATVVDTSVALYETVREIPLEPIESVVRTMTRVEELFSDTHDQLQWQLQMTSEYMYETQENLVYNHPEHGLLNSVEAAMEIDAGGPPSPDVLDDLVSLAWKRPDCYCMHPAALAAFRKAATARGLNLEAVEIFGTSFTTWRGIPIFPTDKLRLMGEGGRPAGAQARGRRKTASSRASVPQETAAGMEGSMTDVLLLRMGLEKQGVVSLYAADVDGDASLPNISVKYMGLTDNAVASYFLTLYTAVAVLSPGALARARVTL